MEELKFEEQMLMDDESFMNMLHSGEEEESFLFCPTSSSSCTTKAHMLCFGSKELLEEEAMQTSLHGIVVHQKQHHKSSDSSSMSSLSSSPPSSNTVDNTTKAIANKKKGNAYTTSVTTSKKLKTEASTGQGTVKVRKEKLGERIMTLQQLVSPFGKSDTASVLHEALGYIRFLHDQVQVLSSPYLQGLPTSGHIHDVRGNSVQYSDLRSRGLCLVPIACTEHVASSNGADLWSPAMTMGISSNNSNHNCCSSSSKP